MTAVSELDAVRDQLRDAVRRIALIRKSTFRLACASAVAAQKTRTLELEKYSVAISLETDAVPARTIVDVIKDGVLFQVRCTLRSADARCLVYDLEVVQ